MPAEELSQQIQFDTVDGTPLRGLLYLPELKAKKRAPGIAMAHGFSAVKEMGLTEYAERFVNAGFAVLLYDHRNLGASAGDPKLEINPWAQTRDYAAALTHLANRPEIDETKLALWGSSFSGGEVMVLGSVDDRVRAVVANVPFAGTGSTPDNDADMQAAHDAISHELTRTDGEGLADPGGEITGPMAVVRDPDDEDLPVFLDQEESAEWFLDVGQQRGTPWQNEVTLRNAFGTEPAFDPSVGAANLGDTALFMVVADEDRVAPVEMARSAFDLVSGPKELLEISGHHFAPYSGEAMDTIADATIAFLRKHL